MKNTLKASLLVMLLAIGLGCGYSSNSSKTMMPVVAQLTPSTESHGNAQFQLVIVGSNFASNAVVNFNGTPMATMFVSSTTLQATIPASAIMNAGMVPVTVTNPGSNGAYGGSSAVTSAPMNFTIS